jgi:hypothetical protein
MEEMHGRDVEPVVTTSRPDDDRMTGSGQDPPKKIPPVAEALGYIGGALALVGLIVLVSRFWPLLGIAGHVGIGVLLAVVGLVGGFLLGRREGDAVQRLSQFLLLVGVAGAGFAVGFLVRDLLVMYSPPGRWIAIHQGAAEWGWFAGALALAISGGVVYWRKHTVLQHLVFAVGVAAAALLVLPLMPAGGPLWGVGAVLVVVSLVWGGLSLAGLLPPRTEGLTLSALGIVGGIEMMVLVTEQHSPIWAMWLGVLACAALIYAGSRMEEYGVLGIGTVGLMLFSGHLIGEYLGFGVGTAIALIVFGLALLSVAVWSMLRQTADASRLLRIATEVASYLGIGLAMGGAGILLVQSWALLGIVGRILVPFVGAVVAYVLAVPLARSDHPAARRLSQTLYAVGVLAAGITGWSVAESIMRAVMGPAPKDIFAFDPGGTWAALIGTVTAAVAGGITWWFRKGSLTLTAFTVAVAAVAVPDARRTRTDVGDRRGPCRNRHALAGAWRGREACAGAHSAGCRLHGGVVRVPADVHVQS